MTERGFVAVVRKENAEALRRHLRTAGLLDSSRRIRAHGGEVLMPVSSRQIPGLKDFSAELRDDREPVARTTQVPPIEIVRRTVDIETSLIRLLPEKWERIGDVLVMRIPSELREWREKVARAYATVLGARSVLEDMAGIEGEWRLPAVEKIWGEETETVHLENGVRFKLDPAKVMFSSGNLPERIRMARVSGSGETVVDLFAGIGYFSIPMAVHSRPRIIHACEINPTAFHYLEENVRMNRTENVRPVLGDCRVTAPEGVADRVVMGYLRGQGFLEKAMRVVGKRGVIHYHEACPNELIDSRPWGSVNAAAEAAGRRAELLRLHCLKSYAPGVSHVVLDVLVSS